MKSKKLWRLNLKPINRKWWYAGGVLLFVVVFVLGDTGFYNFARLHYEKHQIKNELNKARKENEVLQQEVDALKNDTSRIEKVAREEYGMAARDEVIIKVRESQN